jgi:hypothetical protein
VWNAVVKHAKAGGILMRRQELPEEAFISVEELERMFGDGNYDGVLPIIAISFCWLTPPHPDPRGVQLQTIATVLDSWRRRCPCMTKPRAWVSRASRTWASFGTCVLLRL